MNVAEIRMHGGPDVFVPALRPDPVARAGEVVVRVVASSVNSADTKIRTHGGALAPELPAVLGMDVAGIVESVGAGVDAFAPGDAVYGCAGGVRGLPGAYAERIACDARLLAPAPRAIALALRDAAVLPLVAITAWEALFDRARLAPEQNVLVIGGTGGVGHVAVQLAKHRGAFVVATASSDAKAALARGLGADATLDMRAPDAELRVRELTGGRGFDVVFDTTGGSDLPRAFDAARLEGQVVTIVSRYSADLTPMHMKGLTLHVVFMLIPMLHDVGRERHGAILRSVAALVDEGKLRPLIDTQRFELARVADAHRHLESGAAVGKVAIDVATV